MTTTLVNDVPCDGRRASRELPEVRLFPMPSLSNVSGNELLKQFHKAQQTYPVGAIWEPSLKVPSKLLEYICGILASYPAQIRQEAVLMLKRYVWAKRNLEEKEVAALPNLQLIALTCVNLAIKFWDSGGLPEQKLHWLSKNAFRRQDFIDAESVLIKALDYQVHWEGILLAEWQALLLFLVASLFKEDGDSLAISGVAAHVSDILMFHDELMTAHSPCELAAASLHASITICTKRLQRYSVVLRIGHLCRVPEEQVVRLSEEILAVAVGARSTELLLEGSGITAEESDLNEEDPKPRQFDREGSRSRDGSQSPF